MSLNLCFTLFLTLFVSSFAANNILSTSFIASINQKQSLWRAGANFPEDTPLESLKRLASGLRRPDDVRESQKANIYNVSLYDIPDSFDARDTWPQCQSIREIRNQGNCGSCWAFGSAETMTDRICTQSGGSVNFQFSPEDLLECCSDCSSSACESGYTYRAWNYWVQNGIVSGGDTGSNSGCKPYKPEPFNNGQVPSCTASCEDGQDYNGNKRYGVNNYFFSYDVGQIQVEIMTNGPVEAYFDVYDDFYNYQSGVYTYVSGNLVGGHFVKLIGWGTENGAPYWLAANSWGAAWGSMGGFFKILRGQNHVNIELEIDVGTPIF